MTIKLPILRKYRIVKGNFFYEIQVWRLWWPYWKDYDPFTWFDSPEEAEEFINNGMKRVSVRKEKTVIKEL